MRAPLEHEAEEPRWPPGFALRTWADEHAPAVHALLVDAYRGGGGSVPPYEEWLPSFTGDAEFDPSACLLLFAPDARLAGAALCWSSSYVKDIAVAEAFRRRGLGEALLRAVLALFRARGASAVELKVQSDNPSGAVELYRRLGFETVERTPLQEA